MNRGYLGTLMTRTTALDADDAQSKMDADDLAQRRYAEVVGKLGWLAIKTRPDVAFQLPSYNGVQHH